eukprot:gene8053-10911_t
MSREHLLLDPSIRDWVVLPMLIMLVLVGMGRHYVQSLIQTDPIITENDLVSIRHKQILTQTGRLRAFGKLLNDKSYLKRKAYYIRKKVGLLYEKNIPGPANPMSNPMAMVDMMKGNMIYMIPNFAMMGFVGYFFSGFICLKIPFPMPSTHFKLMLQRGVDLKSLDVSYVSSLSWYFLLTFGLNGVYRLLLGEDSDLDEAKMMQAQMGMGLMGGGQQMGFDASAAFKNEREILGIAPHEWMAEREERLLLGDAYPENSNAGIDLSNFDRPIN